MDKKDIKKAEKIIKDLFDKMTFEVDLNLNVDRDNNLLLYIKTQEAQVLIGKAGATLFELQKVLARVLKKRFPDFGYLEVDINDYKAKKERYLVEFAQDTANEVALTKREKFLPAMSAFERRVVHMKLASRQDIKTESVGQDPTRRILVKPA